MVPSCSEIQAKKSRKGIPTTGSAFRCSEVRPMSGDLNTREEFYICLIRHVKIRMLSRGVCRIALRSSRSIGRFAGRPLWSTTRAMLLSAARYTEVKRVHTDRSYAPQHGALSTFAALIKRVCSLCTSNNVRTQISRTTPSYLQGVDIRVDLNCCGVGSGVGCSQEGSLWHVFLQSRKAESYLMQIMYTRIDIRSPHH